MRTDLSLLRGFAIPEKTPQTGASLDTSDAPLICFRRPWIPLISGFVRTRNRIMPGPQDRPKGASDIPSGVDNLTPEERKHFADRLSKLDASLDGVRTRKAVESEEHADKVMRSRGMAMGLRMSTELVAAIAVGGFIGYGLDQWLGTTPWLFLVFFLLGFAAGMVNVVRAFNRMQAEIAARTGGYIGEDLKVKDDD